MLLETFLIAAAIAGGVERSPGQTSDPPGGAQADRATGMIPQTPAGRQLAAWSEAFNRGDRETLARYLTEHAAPGSILAKMPARDRIDSAMFLRGATGGVVVLRVESTSDHAVKAEVQGKDTDDWFCVAIRVAAEPPHGLADFEMYFIPTPERAKSTRPLSEAEALEGVGAYVDRLASADQFSGVVLVARDGVPVFTRVHGQASKAYGVPNRLDTKFNLASMNKMFTAVAVARLAEQGKLAYTDTVGKHLPDYPNRDVAERVTIHHLLTHTSGLGDYFNPKWEATKPRLRAVKDYLPLFVGERLGFEPGATFGYSNAGYIVLGAIIEKVSGQSYHDYVREHVYAASGMADTDSYEIDQEVPNRAQGYTRMGPEHRLVPGPWRNNVFAIEPRGGPAGGGYSTAGDLLRFAMALRDHTLLGSRSTALVLTEQVKDDRGGGYGYGFQVDAARGGRIVGHSGGFAGVHSKLEIYPDWRYVVVVLSNYDRGAARIIDRLRDTLTRVE